MNTTRKHPRTLNEAFPTGTAYAASVEHYRRADYSGQIIVFFVCAAIMALSFYFGWRMV